MIDKYTEDLRVKGGFIQKELGFVPHYDLKTVGKRPLKKITKKRYIVEQYVGLSHLHDKAYRAKLTKITKNIWDAMCRQMAFNMSRGSKLLATA